MSEDPLVQGLPSGDSPDLDPHLQTRGAPEHMGELSLSPDDPRWERWPKCRRPCRMSPGGGKVSEPGCGQKRGDLELVHDSDSAWACVLPACASCLSSLCLGVCMCLTLLCVSDCVCVPF